MPNVMTKQQQHIQLLFVSVVVVVVVEAGQ